MQLGCFPFGAVHAAAFRLLTLVGLLASLARTEAQSLPEFDFTQPAGVAGWTAAHDISRCEPTADGLVVHISGADPYLNGPARDYPPGQPLWFCLRLKSDQGGTAQVFYFTNSPTEAASVRFTMPSGCWIEERVPLPPLGANYRLRMDPPGASGVCVLGRMSFEMRPVIQEPAWPNPTPPVLGSNALTISSGDLSLAHDRRALGAFVVRVRGRSVAIGNNHSPLGYLSGLTQRWLTLTNAAKAVQARGVINLRFAFQDPDGARWQLEQTFQPGAKSGVIEVESRVTVSQDRRVLFLPMLTLLPGVGSFGTNKAQALLAGVEFLENEPSSSEADVIGPGAHRRVPDSRKLTFPLMALSANGNYVGLIWEQRPPFAALHDSPDRLFRSGGHVMGVIFPGSNPAMREDGQVLPYDAAMLRAGQTLMLRAMIIGGRGDTLVPAVQDYVALHGLPALPDAGYRPDDYFILASHGWLDSRIRDGSLFRHAVATGFGSIPAADAAFYMDWLSARVSDPILSARLASTARDALAAVTPTRYNSAAVGHLRLPVEALAYGHVEENATAALNEGRAQLSLFQPDGSIRFPPPAQGTDLGRTHWSREANGLTATRVAHILECGLFSGDRSLINEGLRLLRALSKFRGSVPRGAQTWEVPLHTPDILASAYLVRAYTMGYELTGEQDFLDQARYWAWTGVPFVYLTPPTDKSVGVYGTIAVFGATQFVAPLWIGLPVQWCGLVYGNAIRRLARHDPAGPWLRLADGIAASGMQQTHPASEAEYQGLLPDSFDLRAQYRNAPPINPATLLPEAISMFGEAPVYDFRSLPQHRLLIHALGPITEVQESAGHVSFRVSSGSPSPGHVLVNGFTALPVVHLNGVATPIQSPHLFQEAQGRLILRLNSPTSVELWTEGK